MRKLITLVVFLFPVCLNYCKSQQVNWIKEHELNDNGYHWGVSVCTDFNNNVYNSSVYRRDSDSKTNQGSFITKRNKHGEIVWEIFKNWLQVRGLVTDKEGNLYVSGEFSYNIDFGCESLSDSAQPWTFFIAKLDSNGNCIWSKKVQNVVGGKIAMDKSGNGVYVIGQNYFPTQFDSISFNSKNHRHIIAKYDHEGNCVWVKSILALYYPCNIAVNDKYVTVTGIFGNSSAYFADSSHVLSVDSEWDIDNVYTALFDLDGNLKWAKFTVKADYHAESNSVTIDKENNVYVTGGFYNSAEIEGRNFEVQQYRDVYLVKYNEQGDTVLTITFPGPNSEEGRAIYANEDGIYFSGICHDKLTISDTTIYPGKASIVLAKMNFDLTKVDWVKTFGSSGGGHSEIFQLTSDTEGNVIAVGDYTNDLQVDSVLLSYNNMFYKKPFVISINPYKKPVISSFIKKNEQINELMIYPNPTTGTFHLQFTCPGSHKAELTITNINGQVVYREKIAFQDRLGRVIDLGRQARGVYFVEISDGIVRETAKIVVE